MLPNIGTILSPEMQYGSLIISAATTAVMLALCLFPSKRPGITGYLCLAAGFVGIIASTLLTETFDLISMTPYYYLLYGVYNILIYIPVLVSFHLMAKQQTRESNSSKRLQVGNYLVYLGYLWSIAVLAAGIAFIIIWTIRKPYLPRNINMGDEENARKSSEMSAQASMFTFYSIWGFIAINLILTPIFYRTFKGTFQRCTLVIFNLLTIIAMIIGTVIPVVTTRNLVESYRVIGFIGIFLLDLPNALAIVIWFFAHGGKLYGQQCVSLHGKDDTDTTSSNANIAPSNNHSSV